MDGLLVIKHFWAVAETEALSEACEQTWQESEAVAETLW